MKFGDYCSVHLFVKMKGDGPRVLSTSFSYLAVN